MIHPKERRDEMREIIFYLSTERDVPMECPDSTVITPPILPALCTEISSESKKKMRRRRMENTFGLQTFRSGHKLETLTVFKHKPL